MSYISAQRIKDDVLVWERNADGREVKYYQAPYYFYTKDPDGEYTSMYGDKLTKHEFATSKDFYEAKNHFLGRGDLFESDIPAEMRVLSEHYYGKPAPDIHTTFFDIEVDYSQEIGFSSVTNPYAPINSVALYHYWLKKMVLIAVAPPEYNGTLDEDEVRKLLEKISPFQTDFTVDLNFVRNERELLTRFIQEIDDSDIISGWNSQFFDVPYIGKRLEKYGKDKTLKLLSFPEARTPVFREVVRNFRQDTVLDIYGRVHLDYLELFRKYEQEGRPSYKLESIADEIVPELQKLKYEGSLATLYRKDFLYFIRYNLRDTEILKGFEDNLGYVGVANTSAHLSTAQFTHVTGTIKLSEYSVINECHHELGGLIVNDVKPPAIDKSIQGALVLYPQVGLHEYTGSIDIKSLYPSAIISLNISPETLRGQFTDEVGAFEHIRKKTDTILTLVLEDGTTEEATAKEWRAILRKRKWAVSGYGTVFDQSKPGIIPTILMKWFKMRKDYQKLKGEHKKKKDVKFEVYYDKLQYVYKIKLNSFYGALSNLHFRFYDLRMGESTTGTGRAVLKHQCRTVALQLEGKYEVDFPQYYSVDDHKNSRHAERGVIDPNTTLMGPVFQGAFMSEAVIYGDTDSTYFATFAQNKEEAIQVADAVAKAVNASYKKFMQEAFLCQPGFDDKISCSREIVTDRGIFVNKKRYMLHLIDQDGSPVDKMKVMGLETKKTIIPKWIAKQLNGFIERFLKGEEWTVIEKDIVKFKDVILNTEDLMEVGLPKGVNGVEEYTQNFKADSTTRLPGGVASVILYNTCLKEFNDKVSPPIVSGMKIKQFWLTKPVGRFKVIAIPTDIEQIPPWFVENFSVNREAHVERLIDNPLKNILTSIEKRVPTKQSLLFDSIFGD